MSRRLLRWCWGLLLVATPLAAQERGELERLQRKADSLARLWAEADALATLADSLAQAPVVPPTDTLRVGGLLLITNHTPLPLRDAAALAWPAIDSLYGSAAARLERTPYYVQAYDPDSIGRVPRRWGTQIPWDKTVKETADLLMLYVPMPPADQPYQKWAGDNLRPSLRGWQVDLQETYVALVTSHYAIGRECFEGRIDRCRTLLGLDSLPDPLRLFPTLAERQKVARFLYAAYDQAGLRADVIPCLAGSDSSCQAALARLRPNELPAPVPARVRGGVALLAIRSGGRAAYARLMADSLAPMGRRLSDAAGGPLDSLLSQWHALVVSARPRPVAIPSFGAVVGLGWGLIFGVAALRSSRWRVL